MEFLYLTIVAIAVYFLADRILVAVERFLGRSLPQRSLIFLGIMMVLLLMAFAVIRHFVA